MSQNTTPMAERFGRQFGQRVSGRARRPRSGLVTLLVIVAVMWVVEAINSIESNRLDHDGIYARNVSRLWGILTSPLIHASFQHLFDNTVPLVFLGAIIALHGARRLLLVSAFIAIAGGFGTWLIGPGNASTIGASGIVFGYATYLLARGFFDRSIWELGVGMFVGVIWGAALITSLIPRAGISWQGHLCGAIAGVIVAWRLSRTDHRPSGMTDVSHGRDAGGLTPA